MSQQSELVSKQVESLLAEADALRIPRDLIGRALLAEVIRLWLIERDWQDVAGELRFTADSLDPDTDFEFMRP